MSMVSIPFPKWRFDIIFLGWMVYLLSFPTLSAAAGTVLKVGIQNAPPLVIIDKGSYRGITIDVWDLVARHLGLKFKYVLMGEDIAENLKALNNKQIDIYLGPVNMTYQRSQFVQFTRPYALDTIGVTVHQDKLSTFAILKDILSEVFTITLVSALILLFVYINAIWFFERGRIADLPESYIPGISYIFWMTVLKRGSLPALPTTCSGRIIHFFWLAVSTIILSVIYATTIATFHRSFSGTSYRSEHDFLNKNLVAVEGSSGFEYAKDEGLRISTVKDHQTALDMVRKRRADGYVGYSVTMHYNIREENLENELVLSPFILKTGFLAFALRDNDPLISKIDTELSYMEDFRLSRAICERYLAQISATHCF